MRCILAARIIEQPRIHLFLLIPYHHLTYLLTNCIKSVKLGKPSWLFFEKIFGIFHFFIIFAPQSR